MEFIGTFIVWFIDRWTLDEETRAGATFLVDFVDALEKLGSETMDEMLEDKNLITKIPVKQVMLEIEARSGLWRSEVWTDGEL